MDQRNWRVEGFGGDGKDVLGGVVSSGVGRDERVDGQIIRD